MRSIVCILGFCAALPAFAGSFSKTKEIPNQDPSLYTVGCKTPGVFESKWQFDLRLRPGSVHEYKSEQMTSSGSRKSVRYSVNTLGVTAGDSKIFYQLLALQGIPYQGPTTGNVSCWITQSSSRQCQFIPASTTEFALLVWGGSTHFDENYCAFEGATNYVKKTYQGIYAFDDGRKTDAYQISWVTDGYLKCRDGYSGPGQSITSEVVSNAVPARPESVEYCGGVKIQSTKIYSEGLNLKYQMSNEMTSQR